MTIRSGGRARDRSQAHLSEGGTSEEDRQPAYLPERHGRDGSSGGVEPGDRGVSYSDGPAGTYAWIPERRRRGVPGFVKFLLFAVVLATLVLATLVTVL